MRNCKSCGQFMPNTRIHLGFKECVKCSKVEPYHAHVVYPHKTGAFVQPVSKETKEHLLTVDRRSVKRKISRSGSSSWDRWLKKYNEQKEKPTVQVAERQKHRTATPNYMSSNLILHSANEVFKDKGYYVAVDYVNDLYKNDKISLMQKSNVNSRLADIQKLSKKQRKVFGF